MIILSRFKTHFSFLEMHRIGVRLPLPWASAEGRLRIGLNPENLPRFHGLSFMSALENLTSNPSPGKIFRSFEYI